MNHNVAFLRAINVGGHAVVKMADLARVFTDAGCRNVKTVLQTGNVVLDIPEGNRDPVLKRLQSKVDAIVGTETSVIFRTMNELRAMIKDSPFGNEPPPGDDVKNYVSFMSKPPAMNPPLPIASPKDGLELIGMRGLDVFVVSRKIRGRYGFPNNFVEKKFGVPATTRNWTTIHRIVKMYD